MKNTRARHLIRASLWAVPLICIGLMMPQAMAERATATQVPEALAAAYAPCTLPIVVRGTTLLADSPERSFAMIENKETGHTGPYSVAKGKNIVVAKAVLIEIQELAVLIKYDGKIQRCGTAGHTFSDPNAESTASNSSGTVKPVDSKIDLNSVAGILQAMASQVKREKGGKRDPKQPAYFNWNHQSPKGGGPGPGFKAIALKKESIYYKLGIRNYDLIHNINGVDVKDPTKLMDYLGDIGEGNKLTFNIQRRGKKESIEIDVGSWNK